MKPSPHLIQVLRKTPPCLQLATQLGIVQQSPLLGLRPSPRSPKGAVQSSDNTQSQSPQILYMKYDPLSCMASYTHTTCSYSIQLILYKYAVYNNARTYVRTVCEWTLVRTYLVFHSKRGCIRTHEISSVLYM